MTNDSGQEYLMILVMTLPKVQFGGIYLGLHDLSQLNLQENCKQLKSITPTHHPLKLKSMFIGCFRKRNTNLLNKSVTPMIPARSLALPIMMAMQMPLNMSKKTGIFLPANSP
jgi:hypothetical protein